MAIDFFFLLLMAVGFGYSFNHMYERDDFGEITVDVTYTICFVLFGYYFLTDLYAYITNYII